MPCATTSRGVRSCGPASVRSPGPIVAQVAVPVLDDDDEETLHERIKASERTMLVEWVGSLARSGFHIDDRAVRLGGAPT